MSAQRCPVVADLNKCKACKADLNKCETYENLYNLVFFSKFPFLAFYFLLV